MSTSWVAGTVRAKALADRRLGAAGARALAASPSLDDALTSLAMTPYGHDVAAGQSLSAAEHAIGSTLLWHLRVLAGWLPGDGAETIRLLAGGFEVANVDEHLYALSGQPGDDAYRLAALGTGWSRLAATSSVEEVRQVLTSSPWGDPGSATPWAVHVGMCLAWADRVIAGVPDAAAWARAAAGLLLARLIVLDGRQLPAPLAVRASYVLGPAVADVVARGSGSVPVLAAHLPIDARWVLHDVDGAEDLWRAEASWWHRVEQDGFALMRSSSFGQPPVVGAVAVLAADAWRVRAALETAARGGASERVGADGGAATLMEAFDGLA